MFTFKLLLHTGNLGFITQNGPNKWLTQPIYEKFEHYLPPNSFRPLFLNRIPVRKNTT